ncbi:hypothetical protein QVD17_30261 [Tagetes erecta]|uniref:Uncharacterized protein n=1 Tax=Tagetes erecta TaxID=13708 RepID=A0AAD8K176_TARER|nr:hypothetical protein QVD17_30261 [Tagetes erecta]
MRLREKERTLYRTLLVRKIRNAVHLYVKNSILDQFPTPWADLREITSLRLSKGTLVSGGSGDCGDGDDDIFGSGGGSGGNGSEGGREVESSPPMFMETMIMQVMIMQPVIVKMKSRIARRRLISIYV